MSYGQKTNNPFAPAPQLAVQHTAARFPDVNGDPALAHATQQRMQEEQQMQQMLLQQQQQQQYQQQFNSVSQPSYLQSTPSYLQPSQTGFHPQSSFGQNLSAQMTGMPQMQQQNSFNQQQGGGGGMYGQQQQQPQQHSYGGGAGQYGGGYNSGGYQSPAPAVSDLDPYASLDGLLNSGVGNASSSGVGQQSQTSATSSSGLSHPRQWVNEQKGPLMQFDSYAWKQLMNRLDGLRESWEARKTALVDAGRQGADPTQVDALRKQAELHIDTIHAAKFQLSEVQSGWQHSTDAASKARVREALNAGLTSLPDFPASLAPEQLGGVYGQRAMGDYRKQSILSGFQPQQPQQQQQMMQAQQTGYPQQQYGYQQQQAFQQPQQTGYQQPNFYGGQQYGQQGQYYG